MGCNVSGKLTASIFRTEDGKFRNVYMNVVAQKMNITAHQNVLKQGCPKYTAHTSHTVRIRHRARQSCRLHWSPSSKGDKYDDTWCRQLVVYLLASKGWNLCFGYILAKISSLGNWKCASVVFWNAGSLILKAVWRNANTLSTNYFILLQRLSVKFSLLLTFKAYRSRDAPTV